MHGNIAYVPYENCIFSATGAARTDPGRDEPDEADEPDEPDQFRTGPDWSGTRRTRRTN